MGYIAKTNGGNTVLDFKEGELSSITDTDRANWRQVTTVIPQIDNNTQIRTDIVFTVSPDGSSVTMSWNVITLDPAYTKMRLKAFAANLRWTKQQGGVTLPNGLVINTDDASQAKIHQAYSVLKEGWAPTISYKTEDGWVDLDLPTMTLVAQTVFTHIQNCFNNEKAIMLEIDAGTITTTAQITNWTW